MKLRSGGVLSLAVLVTAGLALTACSSSDGSASGSADSITLYNGQHVQTTQALVAAFEKQTGIKVNERDDDEDVLANQLETEGANSPADVFYTENSPALMQLEKDNLLAKADPTALSAVPSKWNSPSGAWVGTSARVNVLVYNTNLVKPADLPTTLAELADPKWAGRLALAQGETDFQPVVTSMLKAKGQAATVQWLKAVKNNASGHIYPNNETLSQKVNSGEAAIGIMNHYYWYRQKAETPNDVHSAIAYFAPRDPGYLLDISGVGVLASSKHQAAAQKFVEFMVSKTAQDIIGHSDSYEYPIGSGVTSSQGLTPLDQLQPAPLTIADLGDGSAAISLLQQAQLL